MARYGIVGPGPRIIVLILFVLALAVGGLIWFDYLGLIDVKDTVAPVLRLVGIQPRAKVASPQSQDLLDQQRLNQQWEALNLRQQQLDQKEASVKQQEADIQQKTAALSEQEKALAEREKSLNDRLNQYDNRNANLRSTAQKFMDMPPQDAVAQFKYMDDQTVIDILRMADTIASESGNQSISSYWLQLMPPDRAATLARKMIEKPTS